MPPPSFRSGSGLGFRFGFGLGPSFRRSAASTSPPVEAGLRQPRWFTDGSMGLGLGLGLRLGLRLGLGGRLGHASLGSDR